MQGLGRLIVVPFLLPYPHQFCTACEKAHPISIPCATAATSIRVRIPATPTATHRPSAFPKADPYLPLSNVLCLFTGLTKVEMCTDWDGLQFRFPSVSKGRAHKVDIKKTDLQTQAKAFERANPSFTFCSPRP